MPLDAHDVEAHPKAQNRPLAKTGSLRQPRTVSSAASIAAERISIPSRITICAGRRGKKAGEQVVGNDLLT